MTRIDHDPSQFSSFGNSDQEILTSSNEKLSTVTKIILSEGGERKIFEGDQAHQLYMNWVELPERVEKLWVSIDEKEFELEGEEAVAYIVLTRNAVLVSTLFLGAMAEVTDMSRIGPNFTFSPSLTSSR